MYSPKAIFEKEPAVIAEGIRAIFLALVAFNVISLGEQQLSIVLLAASAILTLFVRQVSTPKSAPTLASGTTVKVQNSEETIEVP